MSVAPGQGAPGGSDHSGGSDCDVAIIGAGAAGLSAAAVLRLAGRSCILAEASGRSGGRAHTAHPETLGGARIDAGATWLHQTDRNPLVDLARARGIVLRPAHQGPRRLFVDARPATLAEIRDYDAARAAWEVDAGLHADGPDTALSAIPMRTGPWTATIENWEGAIIAAADADTLSLHDWRRNRLDDNDLSPPEGVGRLLQDLLAPIAGPVRLDAPIAAVDWRETGCCRLHVRDGSVIHAKAVIVTVSTGVLRTGRIAFDPPLPDGTRAALDGLPMGLLSKLALPATGSNRLDLQDGTVLERRVGERGYGGMIFSAWPSGLPYVTGFYGGRLARSLAGRSDAALAAARADLADMLGAESRHALSADQGFVTDWAEDPNFAGAYAFCRPGHAAARQELATPLGDRLLFAGEATRHDGLAGTVGGAILDGERAARWLLEHRFGVDCPPCLTDGFP